MSSQQSIGFLLHPGEQATVQSAIARAHACGFAAWTALEDPDVLSEALGGTAGAPHLTQSLTAVDEAAEEPVGAYLASITVSGFRGIGLHVHIMQALGIVMMLLFFHLYFAPWRRFRAALARGDRPAAARQLDQIRWIVTINLILGLITVAVGSSGRYWG